MRRISAAIAALPLCLFGLAASAWLSAAPASAGTYLTETASAIAHGDKVVASPSTPGYTSDTLSEIALQPGDPTALVELPATATVETGGNGQQFASQLNDLTKHRYIIAVAFVSGSADNANAQYFTATSRLPQSQSDSVMQRATSVGKSPEDVLSTFALYMHEWLQGNPGALRPAGEPSAKAGLGAQSHPVTPSGGFRLIVLGPFLLILFSVAFYVWVWKRHGIPGLVIQLREVKERISDYSVQRTVQSICDHTDRYLVRVEENLSDEQVRDARRSAMFNLKRALKVARGYVDMEQHPDEWPGDTGARLEATAHSLAKFDKDLLEAIQEANEGNLAELDVDTSVLENSII